jgi:hypothetical protein
MKRWTRDAREGLPVDSDAVVRANGEATDKAAMHAFIYASAMELVSIATSSRPAFELAVDYVNRAKLAVSAMTVVPQPSPPFVVDVTRPAAVPSTFQDVDVEPAVVDDDVQDDVAVFAPPTVRSRGRMKASRYKSPIESPGAAKRNKRKSTEQGISAPARRTRRSAAPPDPKCFTCKSPDHFSDKCPLNTVANPVGSSSRKCTSCGCTGHNKSTCGRKSSYGRHRE